MLVLKRKEGQWIEVTHSSGDVLRIRVYNIRSRYPGQLDMAFDDDARNFEIQRTERGAEGAEGTPHGGPEARRAPRVYTPDAPPAVRAPRRPLPTPS